MGVQVGDPSLCIGTWLELLQPSMAEVVLDYKTLRFLHFHSRHPGPPDKKSDYLETAILRTPHSGLLLIIPAGLHLSDTPSKPPYV